MALRSILSLLPLLTPILAQNATEQVWSAVVVTYYGDRVPLLSPSYSVMTPLGAQQMFAAGQLFRERYIQAPTHGIQGIAVDEIDNWQTMPLSMYDIMVDQSAQAFLQGLYPPVANSSDTAGANLTGAALANGSTINAPLNGINYPQIYYAYETDPNYISLAGSTNCPAFEASLNNYQKSAQFQNTASASANFYNSLSGTVESAIPNTTLAYSNAYPLWDYISYETIHSQPVAQQIDNDTLQQLRYLADSYNYQVYGNTTADNGIRAIAGSTLGAQILNSLFANINEVGVEYKLSTLFTSFEPLISLTSMLGLPNLYPQFTGMPDLGSSLVMEMFTPAAATPPNGTYPQQSAMRVRFLFRNGTGSDDNLDVYPIFGNDENTMDMSFQDFATHIENMVDQVASPAGWCLACDSLAVFCAGYTNGADGLPSGPISGGSSSSHSMNPVIAGVIGALVALAVAGLFLIAAMLLFGLRFRRKGRASTQKRDSGMGGFKGSEKLASDVDLPRGAGAGVFGAEITKGEEIATGGNGHRRVESWEMREGRLPGKPRGSTDGHEGGIKAVEAVSPV